MANPTIKNVRKVLKYLKKKKEAVPTRIALDLNIQYDRVKEIIDFLKEIKLVKIRKLKNKKLIIYK